MTIIRARTVFVLRSKVYYVDYRRRRRHTATARSLLHTPLPSSTKKKTRVRSTTIYDERRSHVSRRRRTFFFPFYSSPTYIICVHNRYDNEYRWSGFTADRARTRDSADVYVQQWRTSKIIFQYVVSSNIEKTKSRQPVYQSQTDRYFSPFSLCSVTTSFKFASDDKIK